MYNDPANFNNLKYALFKSQSLEIQKCLEPTEICTEPLIDSHSIQDSRILEALAVDNHVVHIAFDSLCVSKSTIDSLVEPTCKFELISIHKASVFVGLCNKHDTELFRPIDVEELDMENKEHSFLLTYCSVFKELVSSMNAATMNQYMYQAKVDLGKLPGDVPTIEGITPVLYINKSCDFYLYKNFMMLIIFRNVMII